MPAIREPSQIFYGKMRMTMKERATIRYTLDMGWTTRLSV